MSVSAQDKTRKGTSFVLAAVLMLNSSLLGAFGLEAGMNVDMGEPQPAHDCHTIAGNGQDHADHSIACDNCCLQCVGFVAASDMPRVSLGPSIITPVKPSDILPRYATPPLRPPRS